MPFLCGAAVDVDVQVGRFFAVISSVVAAAGGDEPSPHFGKDAAELRGRSAVAPQGSGRHWTVPQCRAGGWSARDMRQTCHIAPQLLRDDAHSRLELLDADYHPDEVVVAEDELRRQQLAPPGKIVLMNVALHPSTLLLGGGAPLPVEANSVGPPQLMTRGTWWTSPVAGPHHGPPGPAPSRKDTSCSRRSERSNAAQIKNTFLFGKYL